MIKKECIPITFFEKIKAATDVAFPKFFDSVTPDISFLKKEINSNSGKSLKQLIKFKDALVTINGFHGTQLQKQIDRLHSTIEYLEDEKKDFSGEHKMSQEQMTIFFDGLYMSKSETSIDGETITPTNVGQSDEVERMFWTFHRFNKYGKKTFRIEEQLTQELFITDVENVDASFLHFPYPSICLYCPFNTKLEIRKELIEYIYISERVKIDTQTEVTRILELIYVTKNGNIESQQFEITNGRMIEQVVGQVDDKFHSPLAKKEATEAISFVLAAILYLNSKEVSIQQIFPLFFHKNSDSRFPVCSLGYNIKIDRQLHYQKSESKDTDKHMNVLKWTVRGHFRNYRMGEHWKENKTIWIRPFLKGRERDNEAQKIKPTNYLVE